jgi:ribosomal protein S12 methylthiotransferase accessory factor
MKKSRLWSTDGTDLGIPAFVALSQSFGPGEERILLGMGCHLEARIALQRAFGELNQMMDLAHAGENGELTIKDRDSLEWLRNATAANQPYVMPDTIAGTSSSGSA